MSWIINILFPIRCVGCKKFCSAYLCKKCIGGIKIHGSLTCIGCNRVSVMGNTCLFCEKDYMVDQLLVVSNYKDPLVKRVIKCFKYRFVRDLDMPISILASRYISYLKKKRSYHIFKDEPLVMAIPLEKQRLNWRGFNQAELIAKRLADKFFLNHSQDIIERKRSTKPQADIKDKEERILNVANVFMCSDGKSIQNRTVILVDDICTTGGTLNSCARELKNSGAKKVIGFVIARG